jgi:YD repeat-containing protein
MFGANQKNYHLTYTWDDDNELTGVSVTGGATVSATLVYDADGRRTSLVVNNVTTAYGYDAASRLTSQSYAAGSTQLGNLSYGLDGDGRLVSEGGSLAVTNLPNAITTTNTFNANNVVTSWNGQSTTVQNGQLRTDQYGQPALCKSAGQPGDGEFRFQPSGAAVQ